MLENAKDGDVVTVSEREKDIVTKESLADFAKRRAFHSHLRTNSAILTAAS